MGRVSRKRKREIEREGEVSFLLTSIFMYMCVYVYIYILIKSIDISKPLMDIFHFTPQIHFSSFILHSHPGALGGYPYGLCQEFPFPPFLQWVLLVEDIGKRSGEQEESQVRIFILHLLCGAPQLKATLLSDGPLPTAHFLGSYNHFLPHLIRLGCQVVMDPCSALWSFS